MKFKSSISKVKSSLIVRLPKSDKLPSRGLVMVEGTMNGKHIQMPLEPDGKGGHWFSVEKGRVGDEIVLDIMPSKIWPEPKIPLDFKKALAKDPDAYATWMATTPMARWDWVRSIRDTNNPDTRKKRIMVACDKLRKGNKRQCCFDRSRCTDPAVSKGGVLLE